MPFPHCGIFHLLHRNGSPGRWTARQHSIPHTGTGTQDRTLRLPRSPDMPCLSGNPGLLYSSNVPRYAQGQHDRFYSTLNCRHRTIKSQDSIQAFHFPDGHRTSPQEFRFPAAVPHSRLLPGFCSSISNDPFFFILSLLLLSFLR